MNEFDKIVADLDGQTDTMSANTALVNDGVQHPNVQEPATAKAVTMVDHPAQYVKTFEEMGRVEQMGHSLKAGWHNTVMANKMADVVDATENAITGASSTMVDETSYDVQEMLEGNNAVSNAIGGQLTQEAFNQARQYGELVAESEQYQPPREIVEMGKAVEGMDLGEGLVEGFKRLWQGDMLGNSIYLFGSSLSAIAPELMASGVGGGFLGAATRSTRLVNAVRTAVMGMGSARVEYGSTIADQLQERGVDLQDAQGLVEKLSDEATLAEIKTKASRRSMVVGGFDALAAGLATAKLSPGNFLRNSRKVTAQAPQSVGRRIASEVGNVATQATVQGALGGAGEVFGSLAVGDEINPGDVLLEMLGEFTTAPVDVGTAVASESFAYVKGKAQAAEALETEKVLNNVSNAVEAIRNDLGNDEAVEAWATRVGQDQTLFSFAQDLVDNGSLEKIREINPELATRIETAAEEHQTVEIPVGEMMTIAAKDKALADEIIKDSRTHVDGMTPREAEEFLKNGKDDAMKLFDKIIKRSNSDIQRHKEARQITQGIADQLIQAGTRKDVAEMQVKPWEAYLVNRSKALGMKPQELADLIHLQVKSDGGVSGSVPNSFASPMTQGKRWRMGPRELDPNERIQVIQFKGQAENREKAIEQILEIASSGLTNEDSGFVLTISKGDLKKSSGSLFSYNERVIRALAPIFSEVVQKAKWLESSNDSKHQNKDVRGIHYFAVPVEIDGGLYRVKLTVRDYATKGQERLATHTIAGVQIYEIENPLEKHSDSGSSDILPNTAPAIRLPATEMQQDRTISLAELAGGRVPDKRQDGKGLFDLVDESAYSEGGVYYSPEDSFNQSAWHGSPHVFDRFSTDHIGTGEGAQAHGWGLYFASKKEVADRYRSVLSDEGDTVYLNGKPLGDTYPLDGTAREKMEYEIGYYLESGGKNVDLYSDEQVKKAIAVTRQRKMFLRSREDDEALDKKYVEELLELNWIEDHLDQYAYRSTHTGGGRVFEVEIPDESEMLDENLLWGAGNNFELRDKIRNMIRDWNIANPDNPIYKWPDRPTGKDIYKAVAEVMGGPKEASLWFNERGIKGITYDGRRDGRCYVVFDDKAIDVLNFYQTNRGTYAPGPNIITLMENADKSTFLHESAHAWLDADTMLADSIADKFLAGQTLTEGELSLLRNIGGFFRWGQREGVLDLNVRNNDTSIVNAIKVWRSMSVQEQTGMHELFAQGFESYLIEGTAPNLEMRTLFQRFSQWLKDVYAHAVNVPKPLSKEVSKLYDLLFISEQEARDAETRAGLMALFDQDDKNINMTAEERKEYDRLNEDAKLEAEGIIRKSVGGVIRTYANIRRQVANRIRIDHKKRVDEVEKQLMLESRHMVREALTKDRDWGHNHRPYRYQFDEKILRDEGYDQETINALKKKGFVYQPGQRMRAQLIGAKGIATLFGHPEPVRLVRELLDIEPARDEATKMVAAEIQMQTGQTFETYSQLQPDVAAHNRTRSRFLNAEFNALARMLGQKSMIAQAAKEYAANKIDEMNVSDVLPYVYVQNEKRCARMAEKFYRQGKFDHCLEAKRGQIVNFEMARTALSLQEEFEKTVRRTKRAVKSKTLYKPYQNILIAIAQAHDIADRPGKANPLGNDKIKEILNELEADGTPIEGIEAALADHKKYKDMTVKQARDLFAILRELEAVARNRESSNLLREKQRIATIVEEGQQRLDVLRKNKSEKRSNIWKCLRRLGLKPRMHSSVSLSVT